MVSNAIKTYIFSKHYKIKAVLKENVQPKKLEDFDTLIINNKFIFF
jgi:hypothetical protein